MKAEIFKTIDMADLNQLQEMVEEALRIRLADWGRRSLPVCTSLWSMLWKEVERG